MQGGAAARRVRVSGGELPEECVPLQPVNKPAEIEVT
jgi:hypothetical protein